MNIGTILNQHGRQTPKSQYTFSVFNGANKWLIPSGQQGDFFRAYCSLLQSTLPEYEQPYPNADSALKEGPLALAGLLEKVSAEIPLVIEILLRYYDDPATPYENIFIRKIIAIIQNVINTRYELSDYDDPEMFIQCVCAETQKGFILSGSTGTRSSRTDRSKHTAGGRPFYAYQIRLYFPYLRLEARSIDNLMEEVVTGLRRKNVLGELEQTPIGDWDQILKAYINHSIPLYGCSERPEFPPCLWTAGYGNLGTYLEDDDELLNASELEPADMFKLEDHALVSTGVIDPRLFEEFEEESLLPLFLSVTFRAQVIQGRTTENSLHTPQALLSITDFSSRHYKTEPEMATELLEIISPDRFMHRQRWIEIGKALHHTFKGTEGGLTVWIGATERALRRVNRPIDFFKEMSFSEACDCEYNEFTYPGRITVKTLAWFAMEDNKDGYEIWHRNWSRPYRQDCYDMTHNSLAKALYCELWLTHACHNRDGKKTVYEFFQHKWQKMEDGYNIRMEISDRFKRQFEMDRADVSYQITQTNDENERQRLEKQNELVNKLIEHLGNRMFKNNVLGEVLDRLTIRNFEEYLDKNGELTGHPNGVSEADMEMGKIVFRAGKPEDFLTKTTAAKLDLTLSWEHPRVKEYMKWMGEMFMNENTCHFVHKLFASGFVAGNFDKIGPFFTGDKNNGKSTLSNFIMRTWGSYAVKFPTTGITKGYSDSGAPNPAMVRISGPRWGLADEPDAKEKLHAGPFKRVFGNDDYYNRNLFSNGGDLENTCTVTVWANKIPPFPDADDACRIRLCCIPCLTTYVKTGAPTDGAEQREKRILPMKKSFQSNIRRLTGAALWVHFQYFPKWCKEALDEWPEEIKNATDEYWQENDIYLMYMTDRIEKAGDNEFITVNQLYKDFELWFTMFNKGETIPDRPTVRYHMTQHLYRTNNNRWSNIRFKDDTGGESITNTLSNRPRNNLPATPILTTSKFVVPHFDSLSISSISEPIPHPTTDLCSTPKLEGRQLVVVDGKITKRESQGKPMFNAVEDLIKLTTVPTTLIDE